MKSPVPAPSFFDSPPVRAEHHCAVPGCKGLACFGTGVFLVKSAAGAWTQSGVWNCFAHWPQSAALVAERE